MTQIHDLYERKFKGDTDAICVLLDLQTAIDGAGLSYRQRQALHYVYVEGLTQKEAGDLLGITRQAVTLYTDIAIEKLAKYYSEVYNIVNSNEIFD